MQKIDLGQSLSILANLGVLIGILLLVYELNQNRQMMEAQTRNDLSDGLTNAISLFTDRQIAELMLRGNSGDELSDVDREQLGYVLSIQFRYYENVHYQYRQGLFDEVEFDAQRLIWRNLFTEKYRAEYWCRQKGTYSPDFAAEIDGLLTTFRCE